ncbi:MAG: sigma-54-dependent Fis family transcriptional regulator [Chlorobi bacterium]|nr:sigma-54-dependent Fis family transcriptional regulator [Chlorobiota bacterium]
MRKFGIVGQSSAMKEIVDTIRQVAPSDITVLLTGESGSGKEVFAKAIHGASKRAGKRMVTVNCGAIPEGILESELFGHEKGAFTGAMETRKGYFELADGGTIFLDEIGEMPIATQVKLLRVLESGEFMRVGSSMAMHVDVRVIAATNRDLEAAVRERAFRQDLYYRLRSINIRIPPLRHRRGDIPLLVEKFLEELADKGGKDITITYDAMMELMEYSWPGNVRELKNVIESLVVLERGKMIDAGTIAKYIHRNPVITDDHNLPVHVPEKSSEQVERELILRALLELRADMQEIKNLVRRQHHDPYQLPPASSANPAAMINMDDYSLEEIERLMIERALDRFHGNRRMAAQALKISERTLYRKIKEYGL